MDNKIYNVNVVSKTILPTPAKIKAELPMSAAAEATVLKSRAAMHDILDGRDGRLFAVVGPCSIHDVDAALEYSDRLQKLAAEVADALFILMRVYFEKPRTTVGWKGLINDPDMDDSFQIDKGIRIARKLLLDLGERGLPTATEALDPIMPQYMGELITWTAIGARTTESQTHREMASGLSTPVGFKNCAAAADSRTTTCKASRPRPKRCAERACPITSSSTAAMPTATRIRKCSRSSRATASSRSSAAIAPSSA